MQFDTSNSQISKEELRAYIQSSKWFHCFDFGDVKTPGRDPTQEKLAILGLPEDMSGKSVIDIGSYDGFFAFESEKRGAKKVVANDHIMWNLDPDSRKNIEFVKKILNSQVELLDLPVEELGSENCEKFDIVLFLGVLYHAPDPIGYLRNVLSITKELLILETLVDLLDVNQPASAFYENLNNDGSNYFGFNKLAIEAIMRKLKVSSCSYKGMWSPDLVAKQSGKLIPFWQKPKSGRMVFHIKP